MEILVVVIIAGIIAAFAIPNYGGSISRTHFQDAVMQLSAIRTANQIYFARTSSYWPTAANQDIAAINTALSLNIIANSVTYTCGPGLPVGTAFTCTADYAGTNPFTLTVTEAPLSTTNPQNPRCTAGTCPP